MCETGPSIANLICVTKMDIPDFDFFVLKSQFIMKFRSLLQRYVRRCVPPRD